jgi:hypothetical protein
MMEETDIASLLDAVYHIRNIFDGNFPGVIEDDSIDIGVGATNETDDGGFLNDCNRDQIDSSSYSCNDDGTNIDTDYHGGRKKRKTTHKSSSTVITTDIENNHSLDRNIGSSSSNNNHVNINHNNKGSSSSSSSSNNNNNNCSQNIPLNPQVPPLASSLFQHDGNANNNSNRSSYSNDKNNSSGFGKNKSNFTSQQIHDLVHVAGYLTKIKKIAEKLYLCEKKKRENPLNVMAIHEKHESLDIIALKRTIEALKTFCVNEVHAHLYIYDICVYIFT